MIPAEGLCNFSDSTCCPDHLSKLRSQFTLLGLSLRTGLAIKRPRKAPLVVCYTTLQGIACISLGRALLPDSWKTFSPGFRTRYMSWNCFLSWLPRSCGLRCFSTRRLAGGLFHRQRAARMAYIRGSGETLRAGEIVQSFVEVEARLQHRFGLDGFQATAIRLTLLADLTLKKSLVLVLSEPVSTGRGPVGTLAFEMGRSSEGADILPCEKEPLLLLICTFSSSRRIASVYFWRNDLVLFFRSLPFV